MSCRFDGYPAESMIVGARLCLGTLPVGSCDWGFWYSAHYIIAESDNFTKEESFSYFNDNLEKDVVVYYEMEPTKHVCELSKIITDKPEYFKSFLNVYGDENKWITDSYFLTTTKLSSEIAKERENISRSQEYISQFSGKDALSKFWRVLSFYKETERVSNLFLNNMKRSTILEEINTDNAGIAEKRKNGNYEVYSNIYGSNKDNNAYNAKIAYNVQTVAFVNCGNFCNNLSNDTLYASSLLKEEIEKNQRENRNNELMLSTLIKYLEAEASFMAVLIASLFSIIAIGISLKSELKSLLIKIKGMLFKGIKNFNIPMFKHIRGKFKL